LEALSFRWSQVEKVTKALWPYSGKGVTGDVKQANRAIREPMEQRIRLSGAESPRAPTFGIYAEREAA
jgi:hypothetical protein